MEVVGEGISEWDSFLMMSNVDKEYCVDECIDERIDGLDTHVGSWSIIAV